MSLNWKPLNYFRYIFFYDVCFFNTYTLTINKLLFSCHLNLYCRYDFLLACLAFAFLLSFIAFFPTHIALLITVKLTIYIFFDFLAIFLTSFLYIWNRWFTESSQFFFHLSECSIETLCMWSTYLLETKILFSFWNFNLFVFP